MAHLTEDTYLSADKITKIHWMKWEPDEGKPIAVLQLVHGMQEFIERYDDFARACADHGFLVVGNDHLGHGASITSDANFGYFAQNNGNRAVIADMRKLHQLVNPDHSLPHFMLGHSMGSFLARQYLCMYGKDLDGAIISGTAYHSALEANFGMTLCSAMAKRKGWHYRSKFVTNLSMGGYNKRFEPVRTPQDWLSRDEQVVDRYRKDPRTQFMFTLNGFYNLFANLKYLTDPANLRRMPRTLPVFFIAGDMDPVGNYGAGVKKVVAQFQGLNMEDVTCRIYPNDRHEVLNELNKSEVYEDVIGWLERHIRQ